MLSFVYLVHVEIWFILKLTVSPSKQCGENVFHNGRISSWTFQETSVCQKKKMIQGLKYKMWTQPGRHREKTDIDIAEKLAGFHNPKGSSPFLHYEITILYWPKNEVHCWC